MLEPWTCPQCSASNDGGVASCRACGALQGAVVVSPSAPAPAEPALPDSASAATSAPGEPPAPPMPAVPSALQPESAAPSEWGVNGAAPAAAQPAKGTGVLLRIVLGVAVVVVVGVIGYMVSAGRSSTGEINKAGDLAPSELRVGDCYDLPEASADASASIGKTVAKPCTESHRYELYFQADMPAGDYPTDAAFSEWVTANCAAPFEAYVGTPYADSSLEVYWMYPDPKAWRTGDHLVQCAVGDPNGKVFTKSLKGSHY